MRLSRLLAIPIMVSACAAARGQPAAGAFTATAKPISPDGTRATIDLPVARHMRNVGGSDGAGLCVYTAVTHDADWQNVPGFLGFRKWAESRPGGSYPDKLDADIAAFAARLGSKPPGYVQHTGGDATFLELALRTGRALGVTYAGNDGFYNETIAHMVNLCHLDATRAAILDNNRPGRWVWMTRAEFLERWRGVHADGRPMTVRDGRRNVPVGGGWAFVWLAAPPPPYPTPPEGAPAARREPLQLEGPNFGIVLEKMPSQPPAEQAPPGTNFGIDTRRLSTAGRRYSVNGVGVNQSAAEAILADDSSRYSLSVVGTPDFQATVRDVVGQLPEGVRGQLRVTDYAPDQWQPKQFSIAAGVVIRKPTTTRVGGSVGACPPTAGADEVRAAILTALNVATPPAPAPGPVPSPVTIALGFGDLTPAAQARLRDAGVTRLDVAAEIVPPLAAPVTPANPPKPMPAKAEAEAGLTPDQRWAAARREVEAGLPVVVAVGVPGVPGVPEYVRQWEFPSGFKGIPDGVYDCRLVAGEPQMFRRAGLGVGPAAFPGPAGPGSGPPAHFPTGQQPRFLPPVLPQYRRAFQPLAPPGGCGPWGCR
jgi:hypothetical protein